MEKTDKQEVAATCLPGVQRTWLFFFHGLFLANKRKATVRQVLQKLHATIVSKDYDGMRALFHPDFERYAFGRFSPELIEGTTDSAGAIKFLHEHGSFLKLAFTEVREKTKKCLG